MRINPNTSVDTAQSTQQAQAPQTQQAQTTSQAGSAFNAQAPTQRNVSGQLRTAEDGISAGLRANLIRSATTPNLSNFTDNLAGSMKSTKSTAGGGVDSLTTKTATPNAKINDNSTVTSALNFTDAGNVDKININLDILHTYRGDLTVKLKSPSGKEVTLSNRAGGSADNLKLINQDLSAQFAGEKIAGNWTLTVTDSARQDTGTLKSWGLSIEPKATTPGGGGTPTGPTKLQVQGDAAFRARVAADFAKFAPGTTVDAQGYVQKATTRQPGHDQGYALIDSVLASPNLVTVGFVAGNAYTQSGNGATAVGTGAPGSKAAGAGSTAQVFYDPALNIALPTLQPDGTIRDEGIASEVILAHELIHAVHAQRGTIDRTQVNHTFTDGNKRFSENWRFEEFRTTGFTGARQGNEPTENSIRQELGYKPRATYLDRSSWTPVNGVSANNGISANTSPNANLFQPSLVGENGKIRVCECFGCGSAGVQPGSNA